MLESQEVGRREARAELTQLRARIAELSQPDVDVCPLCTWRGPVELDNGVCPQCGVDWPAKYAQYSDVLTVAKERIAELEQAVNEARTVISRAGGFVSSIRGYENGMTVTLCRTWLAAHPEQETV